MLFGDTLPEGTPMPIPSDIISFIERLGSVGLLVLLIFKLPTIIKEFNGGIQSVMTQVQAIQKDTLAQSDKQIDKLIANSNERFAALDRTTKDSLDVMKELINEVKTLGSVVHELKDRVEDIERGPRAPR